MNTSPKYTKLAIEKGIEAISIKGVRWFQKSYGNTYHKVYVSALINGAWQELGSSAICYGYGEAHITTAAWWLSEKGFIEIDSYYDLHKREVKESLNIQIHVEDVKRKRDV